MPDYMGKIDDSVDMQTIELHRADSLPGAETEIPKIPEKTNTKSEDALEEPQSWCAKVNYMKIEVVMFLYMFSYILRSVSSTTMIMDKACIVHLGYSEEICKNLAEHKDIKNVVEKLANNYSVGHSLIQLVPSSILACFIGSWSDKYGRKIPIIMALLGIILDGLGSSICAGLFYSRIEFYFIPAIFTGCSGGFITVLTVIYSYAADTTKFSKRTIKYALLELSFGLSMPLGILLGGYLYKYTGYVYVFMISTGGHVLGLIWVMFVIKETRGLDNTDSWSVKLRSLWSSQQIIDSFRATNKKRPNKGREQILALMVATSFAVLSYVSTAGISYLYAHHQYDWDNTKYSTISSIFSILGIVIMMVCVPVFKKLKLGDPTLGLIGSTSMVLKNLGLGLASTKEIYFCANLAGLLSGFSSLAGRSRISKVSSKEDIGKIFAFLTTAESLIPILSTAVASQVFNATLDFYPGLIYLIMGILLIIPLGVFAWLARLPTVNYEEIYNNPEEYETEKKSKDEESATKMEKY
ncbi:proton-coupled folate transporter [Parasteatoda tepidariorum]|nr:proton-coupled folate transporter [Parasteatoda tepidariorum]